MAEATVDKLCSAAATGQFKMVQQILQCNVDPNKKNEFNRTALQVVKMGCPAVVELLLKKGADPNLRDPVKDLTISHDVAREGHADTLAVLLTYVADVNLKDKDGNLPLHLAAREGHLDAVRLLAPCTAHLFSRNHEGLTPIELARAHRREDTARWLESYQPPQTPQQPQSLD
ncbi:cyclin-dependent kinase 4 inhibitor C [Astyanax mexicanus]|uniref:cyclin-dependent kinase 4 inhibitor C n=1 Tax=Astyanax mexicanus TaxID=7994 RepID=UPI0020CB4BBA|nr:cyclin-dependent kinase 4 inhibitor C [Astyanax mexicanus]